MGDRILKLLVIFTGGTIGSTVNEGYISTDQGKAYQLIEMYKALGKRQADFTLNEPYTLLSENLTGTYITRLGSCVLENAGKGYEGIIITHGTDTIQYSAAVLGYLLADVDIPVLLVSSNFVLDDERANGLANFAAAVDFIASKAGTGVFVPYRNSDGVIYVHRGTRLLPHQPYSDDLQSVLNQYYGIVTCDGNFVKNRGYQTAEQESREQLAAAEQESREQLAEGEQKSREQLAEGEQKSREQLEAAEQESGKQLEAAGLELPDSWNSDILRIFPYPGMSYPALEKLPKAILLDTYHSGTLCSATPGMEQFFETAAKNNIPVFLTGASGGIDYESVKHWKSLGVITLPQASPIAMYSKLWLALSSKKLLQRVSLEEIMTSSLGEDIVS